MENNKLRFVIYTRKSQENRDRQALSLESQVNELKDYARREGLEVVKVLEESQTAYKPGRPVFAGMMDMFKEGLANAVLVWKPDRVARNAQDGGVFIQAIDDGKIMELRTPYERFQQADNRMMLYIHFGMSNDYSRQISANVRRGNRTKYARGEFCNKAPLGYLNAKIGNSRNIIFDEIKGPLVKRLFEEYSTGAFSVMDMVRKADDWGLKSVYERPVAKSGMYTLLQRTAYYGVYVHAKESHQGSYPPLISKELFDTVQEVLGVRSKSRKKDYIHAFKGLLKCSACGCGITAETKIKFYRTKNRTGVYSYYRCTRRRGPCVQKAVTDIELDKMLCDMVVNVELDKESWDLGVKLLRAKYEAELTQQEAMRDSIQREYSLIDSKLQKLLDMRLDGEVTIDEYAKLKKNFVDCKVQLNEKLNDDHSGKLQWLERAEDFFETCHKAMNIMRGDDIGAKRDLIRKIGSNLFLKDKKVEFSFKKPYDILLVPGSKQNVQAWKESNPH